ncbi:MAG: ankyrin repeat domain-containing protein [Planctomycetota bacterium]
MANVDVFDMIAEGDIESIHRLLEHVPHAGRTIDARGLSALMVALYHGRDDIVDVLRPGAVPFDAFEAAALGDVTGLKRHLDDDDDLTSRRSSDGFTVLHLACFFGQPASVDACLAAGADPDAVADNPSAVRPLHSAAAGHHVDIMGRLLRAGADPNAAQRGGWTALHAAAGHGHTDMATVLIEYHANPVCTSDDGVTPADLARERNHDQLAGWLDELKPA